MKPLHVVQALATFSRSYFYSSTPITLPTPNKPRISSLEVSAPHAKGTTGNCPCACHLNRYLSAAARITSTAHSDLSVTFNVALRLETFGIRGSPFFGVCAACFSPTTSIFLCYGNAPQNSTTVTMCTEYNLDQKRSTEGCTLSLVVFFFPCANP